MKREGDNVHASAEYDFGPDKSATAPLAGAARVAARALQFRHGDRQFQYSADGKTFKPLGEDWVMVFQLTTFQGVRYALFNYNTGGNPGGQADFNFFHVDEPRPRGLTKPIPVGKSIVVTDLGTGNALAPVDGKLQVVDGAKGIAFQVVDRGRGRISLQTKDGKYVSVGGTGKAEEVVLKAVAKPGDAETFQWVDLQRGDTLFLSLATHRYILAPKTAGAVSADHPGPAADRKDGSCFSWKAVQ